MKGGSGAGESASDGDVLHHGGTLGGDARQHLGQLGLQGVQVHQSGTQGVGHPVLGLLGGHALHHQGDDGLAVGVGLAAGRAPGGGAGGGGGGAPGGSGRRRRGSGERAGGLARERDEGDLARVREELARGETY